MINVLNNLSVQDFSGYSDVFKYKRKDGSKATLMDASQIIGAVKGANMMAIPIWSNPPVFDTDALSQYAAHKSKHFSAAAVSRHVEALSTKLSLLVSDPLTGQVHMFNPSLSEAFDNSFSDAAIAQGEYEAARFCELVASELSESQMHIPLEDPVQFEKAIKKVGLKWLPQVGIGSVKTAHGVVTRAAGGFGKRSEVYGEMFNSIFVPSSGFLPHSKEHGSADGEVLICEPDLLGLTYSITAELEPTFKFKFAHFFESEFSVHYDRAMNTSGASMLSSKFHRITVRGICPTSGRGFQKRFFIGAAIFIEDVNGQTVHTYKYCAIPGSSEQITSEKKGISDSPFPHAMHPTNPQASQLELVAKVQRDLFHRFGDFSGTYDSYDCRGSRHFEILGWVPWPAHYHGILSGFTVDPVNKNVITLESEGRGLISMKAVSECYASILDDPTNKLTFPQKKRLSDTVDSLKSGNPFYMVKFMGKGISRDFSLDDFALRLTLSDGDAWASFLDNPLDPENPLGSERGDLTFRQLPELAGVQSKKKPLMAVSALPLTKVAPACMKTSRYGIRFDTSSLTVEIWDAKKDAKLETELEEFEALTDHLDSLVGSSTPFLSYDKKTAESTEASAALLRKHQSKWWVWFTAKRNAALAKKRDFSSAKIDRLDPMFYSHPQGFGLANDVEHYAEFKALCALYGSIGYEEFGSVAMLGTAPFIEQLSPGNAKSLKTKLRVV